MKAYSEPIEVTPSQGRPDTIRWRRRTYCVEKILDFWIAQSRWWDREERRLYFLIQTNHSIMEIYRLGDSWTLSRLVD